jgi:hypothetical protein
MDSRIFVLRTVLRGRTDSKYIFENTLVLDSVGYVFYILSYVCCPVHLRLRAFPASLNADWVRPAVVLHAYDEEKDRMSADAC